MRLLSDCDALLSGLGVINDASGVDIDDEVCDADEEIGKLLTGSR